MKRFFSLLFILLFACQSHISQERLFLADEIENVLTEHILQTWYPRVADDEFGGYITSFDYEWQPREKQHKMIVTQARHVWTTSKAALLYPENKVYKNMAQHGFELLKNKMWDHEFGGFYQNIDQNGNTLADGYRDEKRTYGNAFGIYALAACYETTHDPEILEMAQNAFSWIENNAHDPRYGGYFQNLDRQGNVLPAGFTSTAGDSKTFGLKDQNSSIHMLEAYTELYKVWPDSLLGARLAELLYLIRDQITTEKGYMRLFFRPDWTPISFQDSSETFIRENDYLDHVSPGHDVETAFLMLEASYALGFECDKQTIDVAKKMVDHAIANAWDAEFGGLFDVGYYFKNEDHLTILSDFKSWWTQMEALNAFLMMSLIFPKEPVYYEKFLAQWQFIKTYLIDFEYGGVYSRPLDRHPDAKEYAKAHAWKGPYHTSRSLMNCVNMLRTSELPF